jgi:hypothetical protein
VSDFFVSLPNIIATVVFSTAVLGQNVKQAAKDRKREPVKKDRDYHKKVEQAMTEEDLDSDLIMQPRVERGSPSVIAESTKQQSAHVCRHMPARAFVLSSLPGRAAWRCSGAGSRTQSSSRGMGMMGRKRDGVLS